MCQQQMMHRHTQRVNEGMLAMMSLMLSSWRGAQNIVDGKCHLPKEVHKAETHIV
jgi:hypothetical protein